MVVAVVAAGVSFTGVGAGAIVGLVAVAEAGAAVLAAVAVAITRMAQRTIATFRKVDDRI